MRPSRAGPSRAGPRPRPWVWPRSLASHARRWTGRWSLRTRLLLTCLAVLVVGLVVSAAAGLVGLRYWLEERLDEQLVAARALVVQEIDTQGRPDLPESVPRAAAPTTYVVELVQPGGEVVGLVRGRQEPLASSVTLASQLPALDTVAGGGPFDVATDVGDYRVLVTTLGPGEHLVVGGSLAGVDETVRRLLLITLATGGLLVVALAVAARWLLGQGLRPVDQIAEAAAAIADGDLSRRVPTFPPSTEIGRLARDLNTMLGQIEAAAAERERGRLRLRDVVADASHELRTPVTAIRAYVELQERGAVAADELPRVLARTRQETERIGALVDDLLQLARLDEAGDGEEPAGRPALVDLVEVAADCVADVRAIEPDRPVRLDTAPSCLVLGDGDQLRQVLTNLLSNVRVHTPPGTPATVGVACEGTRSTAPHDAATGRPAGSDSNADNADNADNSTVVVTVADRGPGMPAEAATRAFDRFYRADPGRGRRTGGSGLGLSIVERIVANHGGTVRLDSEPGRGTVVTVRLPGADPGGPRSSGSHPGHTTS